MDGLLVDSERTTRRVWQASTAACGFVLSDDVYLTLIGLGEDEAEAVLASRFGAGFVVAAFREQRIAGMREVIAAGGAPFKPGAREILGWVGGLGMPIGLATSSRLEEVHERLGSVASGVHDDHHTRQRERGKPTRISTLAAAASLGVEPRSAWRSRIRSPASAPPPPPGCPC